MEISTILKKFPKRKDFVLEILHEIQNHDTQHHLSEESLKKVASYLGLPLAQIYGIVGYYSMFSLRPRGKFLIQLCKSPVCSMMGSQTILDSLKSIINTESHLDELFTIDEVECLGHCAESPCMIINPRIYGNLTPAMIESIINELKLSI